MSPRFPPLPFPFPRFCPQCSDILTLPSTGAIVCGECGFTCRYGDLPGGGRQVSTSADVPEPAWVTKARVALHGAGAGADARAQEAAARDRGPANKATVAENCPECNHGLAEFYTMQLRSADEGQTVFYKCLACAHKWSVNN